MYGICTSLPNTPFNQNPPSLFPCKSDSASWPERAERRWYSPGRAWAVQRCTANSRKVLDGYDCAIGLMCTWYMILHTFVKIMIYIYIQSYRPVYHNIYICIYYIYTIFNNYYIHIIYTPCVSSSSFLWKTVSSDTRNQGARWDATVGDLPPAYGEWMAHLDEFLL